MMDNAALYDIADSYHENVDFERVSYTHLNHLIAQSIYSLTVPFRLDGTLNVVLTTVPDEFCAIPVYSVCVPVAHEFPVWGGPLAFRGGARRRPGKSEASRTHQHCCKT